MCGNEWTLRDWDTPFCAFSLFHSEWAVKSYARANGQAVCVCVPVTPQLRLRYNIVLRLFSGDRPVAHSLLLKRRQRSHTTAFPHPAI